MSSFTFVYGSSAYSSNCFFKTQAREHLLGVCFADSEHKDCLNGLLSKINVNYIKILESDWLVVQHHVIMNKLYFTRHSPML